MSLVLLFLGLVATGLLTAGVLWAWQELLEARSLRVQSLVTAEQLRALDSTLAVTQAQYTTERRLWAAALEEVERP